MRIKIVYKLLIANLSIILILVLSMQVISHLSNKEVLNDFISDIEDKALDDIADRLAVEYTKKGSWQTFKQDPNLWHELVADQVKSLNPIFNDRPPPRRPHFGDRQKSRPPRGGFDSKPSDRSSVKFLERLNLLDAKKDVAVKARVDTGVKFTKAIMIDDEAIGWLTLNKKHIGTHPMSQLHLNKQLQINYWVGSIGVFIATLISYFLSRHITAPITMLSDTAKKIAQRDFTSHIDVQTNDEFKDLANNVNNISKELSKYDEQQKQWLMDISHELRTPLTILQGELEAIADGITPLDKQAILSLQEEVTLLSRLVNDLHDLTVIDKVAFECQQETIDLTLMLNTQLNKFSVKFSDHNLTLSNALLTESLWVKGDNARLCQVTQNILENGLRYINSPGELIVHTTITESMIKLSFEDSGPGVVTDALPKLFDRLYRTDDSRNRKTGGAGLGLSICKNIVQAHGGNIHAEQNNKGGLSIHIQLPLTQLS